MLHCGHRYSSIDLGLVARADNHGPPDHGTNRDTPETRPQTFLDQSLIYLLDFRAAVCGSLDDVPIVFTVRVLGNQSLRLPSR
jgi:hypothetical protein